MKSSKLDQAEREIRREEILMNRDMMRQAHVRRGRSFIRYTCTLHRHSAESQRQRYARQFAAGQLNIAAVVKSAAEPAKVRKPRAKKAAATAEVGA